LSAFLNNLVDYRNIFDKLEKRLRDRRLARILMDSGLEMKSHLAQRDLLEGVAGKAMDLGYETEIVFDEEHSLHSLVISGGPENGNYRRVIDLNFISMAEYKRALSLAHALREHDRPPFTIEPKVETKSTPRTELARREELLETLLSSGKKEFTIQRYKGLGEMNPEQLWETTMNAETRTLLQVRIDDAVETDAIFTVLMGDAVEPRRKFIEDNALDVKNLDI
jgi:DNA gyrase subunit B